MELTTRKIVRIFSLMGMIINYTLSSGEKITYSTPNHMVTFSQNNDIIGHK